MTFPTGVGFQNTGIVVATEVIIFGSGKLMLVYSGTPTLGNLIESVQGNNSISSDKYGNSVLPGHSFYDNTLHNALSIVGTTITEYFSVTAPPGPYVWSQTATLQLEDGLSYSPVSSGQPVFFGLSSELLQFFRIYTSSFYASDGSANTAPETTSLAEIGGSLAIVRAASGLNLLQGLVHSDSNARFSVDTNGLIHWGTGAAAADCSLFREGVGILGTNSILALQNQAAGTPASIAGFSEWYSDSFTQLHTDRAFVTDVNVETKNLGSAPGAGGSGAKTWSKSGHQQVQSGQTGIGGDTNVYDTEKLNQVTTGTQIISSTTGATITGLQKTLGVGTYKITGSVTFVGNQAGGVPTIAFNSGMTVTQGYYNSEYTVRTNNVTATSPFTAFNNTGMDAIGTGHTGPTLTNGGFVEFTFRATLVVSVAGTLTVQAKTTVAADTFTIQAGSYMCIEPVIAT
jgi:hypothetical protein